jgi:hypothetical protein
MHPAFHQVIAAERSKEIERAAERTRLRRRESLQPRAATAEPVALRLDRVHDREALTELAALEGRPLPPGPFVVAEVNGAVVAAMPLGTGAVLADPFRPTAEILPLLALRATQLSPPRRRFGLTKRAARWIASRG